MPLIRKTLGLPARNCFTVPQELPFKVKHEFWLLYAFYAAYMILTMPYYNAYLSSELLFFHYMKSAIENLQYR